MVGAYNMAPITAAAANLAYDKAVTRLKRACANLERHIPPPESLEVDDNVVPSLRPRANSIATCPLCAQELEQLEPGERRSHVCTHRARGSNQDIDNVSNAGSDATDRAASDRRPRNKQPKVGVIQEYMNSLDNSLEIYTDAVCVLCTTMTDTNEQEAYQDHLLVWSEHCEHLKDRARDVIEVLLAAQQSVSSTYGYFFC